MIETIVGFNGLREKPTAWTRLPDFPLGGVQKHGAVVIGDNLYVLTGLVNNTLVNKMMCYSFITKQWSEISIGGGSAATHGHSLYALASSISRWGGVDGNNVRVKQGYRATPSATEISWTSRSTASVATDGQVIIPMGQIALCVGGRSDTGNVKNVQYQQSNGYVTNLRELNLAAVYQAGGDIYNEDAYVYPYDQNQLIIMRGANNPNATKQWEYKPKRTVSHAGNTFTNIGKFFYLFGNQQKLANHTGFERYDPATDTWKMISDTIAQRHNHAVAKYGDLLIIVGGVINDVSTNEVWAFDTKTLN